MKTVLDCPQVHPAFLQSLLDDAAEELGLPLQPPVDTPEMAARKVEEFALADLLLVPSEVARRSFLQAGIDSSRLTEVPLWANLSTWFPAPNRQRRQATQPLRALFIGRIDLRKGIPYLLQAARQFGSGLELTLVGEKTPSIKPIFEKFAGNFRYLESKPKPQLRELLWESDLLVLPSLVDSFGFAAMEAMACGLPVIVSENCGVPVPDNSWRVPIKNSEAIAQRLISYAANPQLCAEDGKRAHAFVQQFTPEVYRRHIAKLLTGLIDAP